MNYSRWSIWLANLDPIVGSEQGKTRPVIIISENRINELLSIVNVLPLTSFKEGTPVYPNEVLLPSDKSGLPNTSIVLCYQIRTLDKRRLLKCYGELTSNDFQEEIINALKFQLGIV